MSRYQIVRKENKEGEERDKEKGRQRGRKEGTSMKSGPLTSM